MRSDTERGMNETKMKRQISGECDKEPNRLKMMTPASHFRF